MNEYSSRSHCLFQMKIYSMARWEDAASTPNSRGPIRLANLNFVDLAGSERVRLTGSEGVRLKEGGHINRSLLSLASVISKLAEKSAHVPFRDSKLTRILQPSLCGASRTLIICAISPLSAFVEESLSTLKFASRAKSIECKAAPVVNELVQPIQDRLRSYKEQIRILNERNHFLQQQQLHINEIRPVADAHGIFEILTEIKRQVSDLDFISRHSTEDATHQADYLERQVKRCLSQAMQQAAFVEEEKRAIHREAVFSISERESRISELQHLNDDLRQRLVELEESSMQVGSSAAAPKSMQFDSASFALSEKPVQVDSKVAVIDGSGKVDLLGQQVIEVMETMEREFTLQLNAYRAELQARQLDTAELFERLNAQQSEYRQR